jgi:hypothetical protein
MKMNVSKIGFLAAMIGWCALGVAAADVTGLWKGQMTDREGNLHDVSFDLKADGTKVTGKVVGILPGSALTAQNGKIEGPQISFQVTIQPAEGESAQCTITAQVAGNQMRGPAERMKEPDRMEKKRPGEIEVIP